MRRANIGSSNTIPPRIVPERGKVSENGSECGLLDDAAIGVANRSENCGDVLDHDPLRSKLANDSRELGPQTTARTCEPSSLPSRRDVLAGEAAAYEIDSFEVVPSDGTDISMPGSIREVPSENFGAVVIDLHLPHGARRVTAMRECSTQPEFQATDPREETSDTHSYLAMRRHRYRPHGECFEPDFALRARDRFASADQRGDVAFDRDDRHVEREGERGNGHSLSTALAFEVAQKFHAA